MRLASPVCDLQSTSTYQTQRSSVSQGHSYKTLFQDVHEAVRLGQRGTGPPEEDALWANLPGPEPQGGKALGTVCRPQDPCCTHPTPQAKADFPIRANCPGVALTCPVSTAKAGLKSRRRRIWS